MHRFLLSGVLLLLTLKNSAWSLQEVMHHTQETLKQQTRALLKPTLEQKIVRARHQFKEEADHLFYKTDLSPEQREKTAQLLLEQAHAARKASQGDEQAQKFVIQTHINFLQRHAKVPISHIPQQFTSNEEEQKELLMLCYAQNQAPLPYSPSKMHKKNADLLFWRNLDPFMQQEEDIVNDSHLSDEEKKQKIASLRMQGREVAQKTKEAILSSLENCGYGVTPEWFLLNSLWFQTCAQALINPPSIDRKKLKQKTEQDVHQLKQHWAGQNKIKTFKTWAFKNYLSTFKKLIDLMASLTQETTNRKKITNLFNINECTTMQDLTKQIAKYHPDSRNPQASTETFKSLNNFKEGLQQLKETFPEHSIPQLLNELYQYQHQYQKDIDNHLQQMDKLLNEFWQQALVLKKQANLPSAQRPIGFNISHEIQYLQNQYAKLLTKKLNEISDLEQTIKKEVLISQGIIPTKKCLT